MPLPISPKPACPRLPELLAPAGDWASLRAAIAAGADAVYFGLNCGFNARVRAANFAIEELSEVMAELHLHGRKGYVTLNTLVFSDELRQFEQLVRAVADAGADAVLVQDIGAARLMRTLCPSLPLHASTQMTLCCAEAIAEAAALGISRVVLPRELTLAQIALLRKQCTVGLEVFVHGALCISFSGQCAASLSLGGRSANRGRCAQACRLPYTVLGPNGSVVSDLPFPLSPRDLAALALVPQLISVGVDALKIEGRLKKADYVDRVVRAYRRVLDACAADIDDRLRSKDTLTAGPSTLECSPGMSSVGRISSTLPLDSSVIGSVYAEAEELLRATFSRGFCRGWLEDSRPSDLVSGRCSGHEGVFLGTIDQFRLHGRSQRSSVGRRAGQTADKRSSDSYSLLTYRIRLNLAAPLSVGDGVAFDVRQPSISRIGGRVLRIVHLGSPQSLARAEAGAIVEIIVRCSNEVSADLAVGMSVFKTDDSCDVSEIHLPKAPLRLHFLAVVGRPMTLTAIDPRGLETTVVAAEPVQRAQERPTDAAAILRALHRFSETPWTIAHCDLAIEGRPLVPLREVNQLRRKLILALKNAYRPAPYPTIDSSPLEQLRRPSSFGLNADPRLSTKSEPSIPCTVSESWHLVQSPPGVIRGELPSMADIGPPRIVVLCRNMEQLRAVENAGFDEVIIDFPQWRDWPAAADLCRSSGRTWWAAAPRVQLPGEEDWVERFVSLQPQGVLARNLANLRRAREFALPAIADYSLNAVNDLSADWLLEIGAGRIAVGLDAGASEIVEMLRFVPGQCIEMIVHAHLPMFHTAHCMYRAARQDRSVPDRCQSLCQKGIWRLRDRKGFEHPMSSDLACRNTVFQAVPQSAIESMPRMLHCGVRRFRVEASIGLAPSTLAAVARVYQSVLDGRYSAREGWQRLLELHPTGVGRKRSARCAEPRCTND